MTHTTRTGAWLALGITAVLLTGCGPAPTKDASSTADTGVTAAGHRKCAIGQALDKCPLVTEEATAPATTVPAPATTVPAAAKRPTVAQQQALIAAQSYVDLSGFSKAGLLEQLTSSAGNGFNRADATWAVNHVKVDWNAEAVESAQSYLQTGGGFSHASLMEQLTSSAGSGFTKAQALYAVKKVGL